MDVSLELLERRTPTEPVGSLARWVSIQFSFNACLVLHPGLRGRWVGQKKLKCAKECFWLAA